MSPGKQPSTPKARLEPYLEVPVLTPIPRHRLSPVLDEFSLRRTPSRGGTASPAPARGVRKRLHQYRNLDHAVDLVRRSHNIVVLTGAGISTSVGIPDFRSDKGLYSQLSKDLGITEAEEFFSRDYFIQNTEQFFQYVKRVIPEAVIGSDSFFVPTNTACAKTDIRAPVPKFSLTHAFLALLHGKRKLLTNYTQNIDGLETAAGVPRAKFIQCHGSWDTASCMTCGRSSAARKYLPVVFAGNVPYCKCKLETEQNRKKKQKKKVGKKRSWDDFDSDHSSDDGTQAPRGLLKPDITFFNERLSGSYGNRLDEDKRKIDLLIIIGTSLKVGPVQDMLYQISPKVPQIFLSKERFSGALCNLPGVQVDIELLGECDLIIEEICRRAGWSEELKSLCWEPGQTNMKSLNPKFTKPAPELSTEVKEAAVASLEPAQIPIIKSQEVGSEMVNVSNNASTFAKIEKNEKSEKVTATAKIERLQSQLQSISHEEQERKPVHQPSMLGQGMKAVGVMQTATKVKLELVEGTTHQWRVSRNILSDMHTERSPLAKPLKYVAAKFKLTLDILNMAKHFSKATNLATIYNGIANL